MCIYCTISQLQMICRSRKNHSHIADPRSQCGLVSGRGTSLTEISTNV